jgi:hypothetical protein
MDEIVRKAMTKWPNVPHCYGWLGLDARGVWRMRNEQTQALGLAGDKIAHPALLAFIHRNYAVDERGCWYFQNGPQRVYVNLEMTPYIARTDPALGFVLHTGQTMNPIEALWLTENGQLLLQDAEKIALLDDRDLAACMDSFRIDGMAAGDDALLAWLDGGPDAGQLTFAPTFASIFASTFSHHGQPVPVQRIIRADIANRFGFVGTPQAPNEDPGQ